MFRSWAETMNLEVHFVHFDYFPENLSTVIEEEDERFHQVIKEMKRRYQSRWNVQMVADIQLVAEKRRPPVNVQKKKWQKAPRENLFTKTFDVCLHTFILLI